MFRCSASKFLSVKLNQQQSLIHQLPVHYGRWGYLPFAVPLLRLPLTTLCPEHYFQTILSENERCENLPSWSGNEPYGCLRKCLWESFCLSLVFPAKQCSMWLKKPNSSSFLVFVRCASHARTQQSPTTTQCIPQRTLGCLWAADIFQLTFIMSQRGGVLIMLSDTAGKRHEECINMHSIHLPCLDWRN